MGLGVGPSVFLGVIHSGPAFYHFKSGMNSEISRIVIYAFGYFILVVSLVPLVRNDNWAFRVFEYPRAQKLVLNVLLLIAFFFVADWQDTHAVIFACLLFANTLYLSYQVYPYTFLAQRQMKGQKQRKKGKHFRLLISNVYQENREFARCTRFIEKYDPDILLLVETDTWWKDQLIRLDEKYPYHVLKPLENTYGMLLYSRLELIDPEVKFLVEPDIPSIHTRVKLPSGDTFFLYCLHPQPPVPQENPRSTERDGEILLVAKEAKASKLPVIVAGDLNDVAWSYTTELFLKTSRLLDPRRGRGFFNTFHAKHWFLRWPLDHIFCSKHFQLVSLKRLPAMGSDHFPILVELGFAPDNVKTNGERQMEADAGEKAQVEEKIQKAGL